MSQGLSEGVHVIFLKAFFDLIRERLRPRGAGRLGQGSSSYPCVSVTAQQNLFDRLGGRSGPAHSNQRKGLSSQGLSRARRHSEIGNGLKVIHRLGLLHWPMCNPSASGVVWPVQRRHQSTPKPRASATMACFLLPGVACGSSRRGRHFLTSRYSG